MDELLKAVRTIKNKGLYPDIPVISSPHKPEVIIGKKKYLLFASNNYLGMMTDERVIEAADAGLKKWGIGNGSSRLLTGNLEIHTVLENEIAKFKNKEAALTFVTGYMVNSGCIPAITNVLDVSLIKLFKKSNDTVIFSDEYNHASIISGISLSKAKKEIFKHNDPSDLEDKLKRYSKKTRKLIISDGVFSMDGDIVRLPELVELAKKYKAMLYIDDAHSTGILGKHGRGTEDYFNMEGNVDFVMGTFTKAFGGVGGFITSKKEVIDYLRITAKTNIFTAPIAPPVACGLIESVKIVTKETWRREKIIANSLQLRKGLSDLGYDILGSETQIVPVYIGDEKKAMNFSKMLFENGILISAVRWPAVPKGSARLRLTVMATHTTEQIDYLLDIMKKIKNKL